MIINDDKPVYFEVKMGKSIYEIELSSLVSTMTHQFLSSKKNTYNLDHYEIIYITTKSEITEYINHLTNQDIHFIDLFDDWISDFHTYQNEKNKVFCKDLIIEFSDQSKWCIKLLDLLAIKNGGDLSDFEVDYQDPILNDEKLMIKWVNSLKWKDISILAEEIQRPQPEPDYGKEWRKAKKEIKEWDKTLNILDLLEISNIEDEDDQTIPDNEL